VLFLLFFSMHTFPNTTWFWECDTHDMYGEGAGMERVQAWKGCRHGQGTGMDRARAKAWLGHG